MGEHGCRVAEGLRGGGAAGFGTDSSAPGQKPIQIPMRALTPLRSASIGPVGDGWV